MLLAIVVLAGLGGWLLWHRFSWEHYSGAGYDEAAVPLDHPRSWQLQPHTGQFVVLAPEDLTSLFTPTPDWDRAIALARDDPERLVGAKIESGGIPLRLNDLTSLAAQLENQLKKQGTPELSSAVPPADTPSGVELVDGTLGPPDGGSDATLYVEIAVVPLSNGGQGRVLLFCRQEDRVRNASTFDRIIESLGS